MKDASAHTTLPTADDVEAAAQRIAGVVRLTPLLADTPLDALTGARVLIKAEPLQRTGSFKIRGAYNHLSQLAPEQRDRGVVAFSSGNHAQGVALAASLLGIPALIIMPSDAPDVKIAGTRALGARIQLYDRYTQDREAIGRAEAERTGATLVPSYDDFDIIAGQGTVGLEIALQSAQMGLAPDIVLCCCGGGGLIAGSALALRRHLPKAEIYAVEPEDFDDTARSLKSGVRTANDPAARSICDALLSPMPGALTFPINRDLLAGALTVSDDEVRRAMATAFSTLKIGVEPGGAVALAALLSRKIHVAGRTVAVVLSGGNVDAAMFAQIIAASHAASMSAED